MNRAFTPLERCSQVLSDIRNLITSSTPTNNRMRSPTGFTLTETIITIAMTAVIMMALANLYLNFNSLYAYQQTFVATTNAARNGISALRSSVLPANQVLVSHSFSGTTVTSGANALVLTVPSVDAAGDIVSGAYDYIGFYLVGTELIENTEANAASTRRTGIRRAATLVASIVFTYDTANVTEASRVAADITTRLTTKNGPVETSLFGQFYLRNK